MYTLTETAWHAPRIPSRAARAARPRAAHAARPRTAHAAPVHPDAARARAGTEQHSKNGFTLHAPPTLQEMM